MGQTVTIPTEGKGSANEGSKAIKKADSGGVMKLQITNYRPKRSTQTVTLFDDAGDPLFEDTFDLSKERQRRHFARKLVERYPSLKGKDMEAQLLNLLWEVKDAGESAEAPAKDSQADRLVKLVEDRSRLLFHDTTKMPFAHVPMGGHSEIWKVRSKQFKLWLAREFWQKVDKTPNSDAINSALNVIEGKACFDGPEHELHNRVAWYDGALWFDLADQNWRAVKVTPGGWQIIEHPPLLFQRYAHQLAQVEPILGGNIRQLLEFTNLKHDTQELLMLVYTVTCFIPSIPHPIPQLYGEKGSAKTTLFRIIKTLVDPSAVEVLSFPGDLAELVQQLSHHWIAYFDNVSHLSDWVSDVLCRASTGEGFTKRELYSDDSDVIYSFRRCVGLNGVNMAAMRPDLLDRIILFNLERIPPRKRREERQLLDEFKQAKPAILGSIFDTLAKGMAIYPLVDLKALPRMADFARWGSAIAVALGYSESDFLEAYEVNTRSQTEEVLSSSPVAEALVVLMEDKHTWEGRASELLQALGDIAENELKIRTKTKLWPGAPHILTRRLNELKGNLRDVGIVMGELPKTGREGRRLIITRMFDSPLPKSSESGGTSGPSITENILWPVVHTESDEKSTSIGDGTPISIASRVASPESLSADMVSQIRGDAGDAKTSHSVERNMIKELLGMEIGEALELWRGLGAPAIHLGPGENCLNLEKLLSGHPRSEHLQTVGEWLKAKR